MKRVHVINKMDFTTQEERQGVATGATELEREREERRLDAVRKDLKDNERNVASLMARIMREAAPTEEQLAAFEREFDILADERNRLVRWLEPSLSVPREMLEEWRRAR